MKLIMGPRRYNEALAAAGLQPIDIHERDVRKRAAMFAALWVALENACDPRFRVVIDAPEKVCR